MILSVMSIELNTRTNVLSSTGSREKGLVKRENLFSLQRRMEIPRVTERNGVRNINSIYNIIVHVVQMI